MSEDKSITPRHVAIIMDGNGRWAAERGLPRSAGHKAGIDAVRRTVKSATDFGIETLTIYSFSTENWSRPKTEVAFLMQLLKRFIAQDVAELHAAGVKIVIIGSRAELDPTLVALLADAEKLTAENTKLKLVVAFNYGSRQEMVKAAQSLAAAVANGQISVNDITCESFGQALDTHDLPDPDLLIRTGGEQRISNFLLWQCAYTEFVFLPQFWPEFTADHLASALDIYKARDRRFGGLKASTG